MSQTQTAQSLNLSNNNGSRRQDQISSLSSTNNRFNDTEWEAREVFSYRIEKNVKISNVPIKHSDHCLIVILQIILTFTESKSQRTGRG